MKPLVIAIVAVWSMLPVAVYAQDSAKVQVTIKIPASVPSFKDQRLVVMLHQSFPEQPDRPKKGVDKVVNQKFSHQKGTETVLTLTVGESAKASAKFNYTLDVTIFDSTSKATHRAEIEERRGPFPVLNSSPNRLTVTLRPVQ